MGRKRTSDTDRWLVGATILLAFGLRVHRLAGQSIWYDEGLSVYYARRPFPDLLRLVSTSDHPPLYFLILHTWLRATAFGRPAIEFLVRYPSVTFDVLTVPLVYALGRRLFTRRAGMLAALLIAISPIHVWYSQETRMYTLVVLLTLWASYTLWTNLQSPISNLQHSASGPSTTLTAWATYSLLTALALYAHFYAILLLLAHAVFITWWAWRHSRWQSWARWAIASSIAILIFLPWGGLVAGQLRANDTYWRGTLALGRTILDTAQAFAVGETMTGPAGWLTTAVYVLLAAIGLLLGSRGREPATDATVAVGGTASGGAEFLSAYVLVPLLALLAISYNHPKFAPRYLLTATPALALLAGRGVEELRQRWADTRAQAAGYALGALLLMGVIAGNTLALRQQYIEESQFRADWRAAARYIREHATPRDAVVVVAGHAMPAFDFYNLEHLDVYAVPPKLLPAVSDPVETDDVVSTLNRLTQDGHDRAWLILWQERLADPRRLTLNQFFEHGQRLGVGEDFHDLGVLLFELPPGTLFASPRPQHALDTVFGRRLRLDGYDLDSTSVAPGDTVTLRLYWRAVEPLARNYTAFTQLLSPADQIVGQHDRQLGGDFYPTSGWPVGEPVRETYDLRVNPETRPGRYRLIAGVYLAPAGPRLPVEGNKAVGDHVLIEEIEIGP